MEKRRTPNVKLKSELFTRGLSQQELSFAIGIDGSQISKIVRGWQSPKPETRKKISEFLKVRESDLF